MVESLKTPVLHGPKKEKSWNFKRIIVIKSMISELDKK